MKRGVGVWRNAFLHGMILAALVAAVYVPSRPSSPRSNAVRGAGHHDGRCHACSFALSPELTRARDLSLFRAGCIELADADD